MTSLNLLIGKDGNQLGPFTEEQVRSMMQANVFSSADLAWHDGRSDWAPLWQILGMPPPLPAASIATPNSGIPDSTAPQQLINSAWILVGLSFVPNPLGVVAMIAFLVFAILLFRHPHPKARWHGKVLLCVWGALFLIAFCVILVFLALS